MIPLADTLAFATRNRRFLAFGFLLTLASSAGQTFFIGLFGPELREAFALSHTGWGGLYLIGTLASACLLPWTGQGIDRLDLRWYVALALGGLAAACLVISTASSVVMLTVAIFLLRHMGQGLTSHTAATAMARYYGPDRGKALSVAWIGIAVGEALLPWLAVMGIALLGWRNTYGLTAAFVGLVLLPAALWLLRGHGERHARHLATDRDRTASGNSGTEGLSRRQMLADPCFYLLLPAFVAPSLIITAQFFHHLTLAEGKGWTAAWLTGQYWVFALFGMASALIAGPLIDRLTARRVMPMVLLPMAMGLILVAPVDGRFWLIPYLALLGLSSGVVFTGFNAIWPELYGTAHLGAIRSLAGAIGVFASALGPVITGGLLDAGFSMEMIGLGYAGYCLLATLLLMKALQRPAPAVSKRSFDPTR